MPFKKEVLFIPFWIKEALDRNKLPLSAALDFVKLQDVVSTEDLQQYMALAYETARLVGKSKNGGLGTSPISWLMDGSIPKDNPALQKHFYNLMGYSHDEALKKSLESRLFGEDSFSTRYKEPFQVFDPTDEVVGVVIYPGYFTDKDARTHHLPLMKAILAILYRYGEFHEVARTSSFSRFLDLLDAEVSV